MWSAFISRSAGSLPAARLRLCENRRKHFRSIKSLVQIKVCAARCFARIAAGRLPALRLENKFVHLLKKIFVVIVNDLIYPLADSIPAKIDSAITVFDSADCQSNNIIIEFD